MAEHIVNKETVFVFWAVKNTTGVYPFGATGTISVGNLAMMQRARGFQTADITQAEPELANVLADGAVFHSYRKQPTQTVSGSMGFLTLSQDLSTVAVGSTLYTEGEHSVELVGNSCITYAKICMVVNSRADVLDDTTGVFTSKWEVEEYLDVDLFPQFASKYGDPSGDAAVYAYPITFREPSKSLYGETFTTGNYGRTKGFARRYSSANPVIYGTIVGDGSTVQYTIPAAYDPIGAAATYIQMWDDGTEKTYGSSAGNFELNSSDNQLIDFPTAEPANGSIEVFKLEFDGSAC